MEEWMPQFENTEIIGRILRTTIGVISRRTSGAYANVIIGNAIKELSEKYKFLRYIEIQRTQYTEMFDVVTIASDLNNVEKKEIGTAAKDFLEKITMSMGKNAGYYFIKEIKEDLPYDYEKTIKELGIDLDLLQLEFITEIKQSLKSQLKNSDVIKLTIKTLFDILDRELGRDFAFTTLNEIVRRFTTEYEVLKSIKINDIRSIQNVDLVSIVDDINEIEPNDVGTAIQKIIQEVNYLLGEQGSFTFIEKLRNNLNEDYLFKLGEMGVNINVLQLNQVLVVKQVLKALTDVLSELSDQSYAILTIDNVIKQIGGKYDFFKFVKIDSMRYSDGIDAINVPSDIETVRPSEVGRGIQRIVEDIAMSLGEEAGQHFIEKLKKRLGKAYVLRIEEMGVNLHMIELKQNLSFNL
jgi:hypothetical protein